MGDNDSNEQVSTNTEIETEDDTSSKKEKKEKSSKKEKKDTPSEENSTKNKIDPLQDFMEYLRENEEASEFMAICVSTGEITKETKWSEFETRQWLTKFEQWKKLGKPRPSMPSMPKAEIRYPTHAYRIRDKGTDKMYVYYSDRTKEGMEEQKIFEEVENPAEPGQMVSTGVVKQTIQVYNKRFNVVEAANLIKEAEKINPPHNPLRLYFFYNNAKTTINAENFVKDYDSIIDRIVHRQPVN
jgi:hypothetical protein